MGSHPSKDINKSLSAAIVPPEAAPDTQSMKKYNKIGVIGRGGFGKVWRVEAKKDKKPYALKEMIKARVLFKKSVESVMNELNLLKCLKHEFLINAVSAFQDRENLYLLMDLVAGGDLRFHLIKLGKLNEEHTKFFVCCILIALEYLHNNGIIHRDLKPQNLVFDKKGYLRLTDLGVARIWKPENSNDTSGTPGYMAPQVMCRCNHGVAADYYALGVIVHECIFGKRPYVGESRQQIRDKILAKQVSIKRKDCPMDWSPQSIEFVNQLIQRKPQNRLGFNGPSDVMGHPWLRDVNWERIRRKQAISPFAPVFNAEEYQDQLNNIIEAVIPPETIILLKKETIQNLFSEYNYDGKTNHDPLLI